MAKNKKEKLSILFDLHYRNSLNHFEEFYGDSVKYSLIEQESYIDLKEMVFEKINKNIKFRKFGRIGNILTIKMDLIKSEYELFIKINNKETVINLDGDVEKMKFNFMHDFVISNIRYLTNDERIRFKKEIDFDDDEVEEELNFEEEVEEIIDSDLDINKIEVDEDLDDNYEF